MRRWHLRQDGKTYGPVAATLLEVWIEEGRVKKDALLRREMYRKWRKITEVEPFRRYFVRSR